MILRSLTDPCQGTKLESEGRPMGLTRESSPLSTSKNLTTTSSHIHPLPWISQSTRKKNRRISWISQKFLIRLIKFRTLILSTSLLMGRSSMCLFSKKGILRLKTGHLFKGHGKITRITPQLCLMNRISIRFIIFRSVKRRWMLMVRLTIWAVQTSECSSPWPWMTACPITVTPVSKTHLHQNFRLWHLKLNRGCHDCYQCTTW